MVSINMFIMVNKIIFILISMKYKAFRISYFWNTTTTQSL